ncbi:MAG TPA: hypothetical protein VGB76_08225 [Pyrinomonadaceae bacterium]|jgi:hypothetical protein
MSLEIKSEGVEGVGEAALRPRDLLVAGVLMAALAGVRLWRLDASCLWFDEVFSVHAARHGWRALVDFVALDLIHPPLFYLSLKGWIGLVGSEAAWWVRVFAVLTATAACVPVMLLCRELGLRPRVGHVALGLMAASGFLIQHGREVRMYSLLLLLAACSLWLFARYTWGARGRKRVGLGAPVSLFVVNLLLVYTHYYGWLLVGHELIFLAVWGRERLKEFAAMSVALAVCYSPWLWMVWEASGEGEGLEQNIGWAIAPRVAEIVQPFLLLHEPFRFRQNTHERAVLRVNVWLALAVFVPAFVALGWRVVGRRRAGAGKLETTNGEMRDEGRDADVTFALKFLIFFSTAPVVAAFLLARVLPHSVWGVRHLIIIAPVYLLLAAYALYALRPLWLATTIRLLLGCWLALAAMLWLVRRAEVPPVWCAWETLARRVVETETTAGAGEAATGEGGTGREVKIYATEELVAYHLWYALSPAGSARSADAGRFRVAAIANLPGLSEDRAFFLPRGFAEVSRADAGAEEHGGEGALREEHFWAAFRDTSWNAGHPLLRLLSERGYEIEKRFELTASGQKAFIVSARRRRER